MGEVYPKIITILLSKKNLPMFILIIALIVLLPLIFILNGYIWVEIYFLFWFLLFIASGINAYIILQKKLGDMPYPFYLAIGLTFVFFCMELSVRIGDEWISYTWIAVIGIITLIIWLILGSAVISNIKKYSKRNTYWKKYHHKKLFRFFCILINIFIIFNATLFLFPYLIGPILQWKAENNQIMLKEITTELTSDLNYSEDKAYAIFEWFNSNKKNMYNTWRPPALHNRFVNGFFFSLRPEFPFILLCVRHFIDVFPLWILTSQCGNCGEYAILYSEIAHSSGLTVRKIEPFEMDHVWNEVLIDENNKTWIIVDPLRYLFKPDPYIYRNEVGNFSYVYAEYPDSTDKIDVTKNYTDIAIINISTVDIYGEIIPNVSIKLISHNNNGGQTGRNFKTNESGFKKSRNWCRENIF